MLAGNFRAIRRDFYVKGEMNGMGCVEPEQDENIWKENVQRKRGLFLPKWR